MADRITQALAVPASTGLPKCDGSPLYGSPCRNPAMWLVRVGRRESDGQLACAHHLSAACMAMLAAEGRDNVDLTVRRI